MEKTIVVDSCCDMPKALKEELNITTVPLSMMLGRDEYIDDESLDLSMFMRMMKLCKEKVGSASPSPYLYQKAIELSKSAFVITISNKLSGSYGNATLASTQARADNGHEAYVIDSKSASAGETLVALKLHELLKMDWSHTRILSTIHDFIGNMKTYFVLENYDNLKKNGRLNKITGNLIQMLNIKLIMGADKDGNIALYEKVRGARRMVSQLIGMIEKSEKKTEGENLVLAHCNNPELAEEISAEIKRRFSFKKVLVVPTGGLSSMYADDRGIIMAF